MTNIHSDEDTSKPGIELTVFKNQAGSLSKRISLNVSGQVISDGSGCLMWQGEAERLSVPGMGDLSKILTNLQSSNAIALGRLRADLPEQVTIATRKTLASYPGGCPPAGVIARTADSIGYAPGKPALVLVDYDRKAMTNAVRARLDGVDGAYSALVQIIPAVATTASLSRASTSANLSNADTGERIPLTGGAHLYLSVADGSDIPRFLSVLHDRCWLAGFGWYMAGAGGALLERSIIDRMVGAPERLIFEGPPQVMPPLVQGPRIPLVSDGVALDTRAACPDLTPAEASQLAEMKADARHEMKPQADQARVAFIDKQSRSTAARLQITDSDARELVEKQLSGVLLPGTLLLFDLPEFDGCAVADVLKDPDRFLNATLADPIEGVEYGTCKAKILKGRDGGLRIHSFAHGEANYDLKYDYETVKRACDDAGDKAVKTLCRLVPFADLTDADEAKLIDIVQAATKGSKRAIQNDLKAAKAANAKLLAPSDDDVARKHAGTRARYIIPSREAPYSAIVYHVDGVLSRVKAPEPPMRDKDNEPVEVIVRKPTGFHLLRSLDDVPDPKDTPLPPPPMALLTKHDVHTARLMIEKHICHLMKDQFGGLPYPVALRSDYVQTWMKMLDSQLPRLGSIVTTPVVKRDKTLLAPVGLDRESGVVFRIDPALHKLLPKRDLCTPDMVRTAMKLLTDVWLGDVLTDDVGKATLIAMALTKIQRAITVMHPGFIVTAGRRGGGKTTTIHMISNCVEGRSAAAVAWSNDPEERRKSLMAHLSEGPPEIVFDNIPRGYLINCQHLDAIMTSEERTDRVLGVSQNRTVSTKAVFIFTGNNIGAKGDTASRMLTIRLNADRPDPENRPVKHTDPIGWTLANRGKLLTALYVVLMGNQRHETDENTGRFKDWWQLVGSAVEYAAEQCGHRVRFGEMLLDQESDDEESSDMVELIETLHAWKGEMAFSAADVANEINDFETLPERRRVLREQLAPESQTKGMPTSVSPKRIGLALRAKVDATVFVGDLIGVIKGKKDTDKKTWNYQAVLKTKKK